MEDGLVSGTGEQPSAAGPPPGLSGGEGAPSGSVPSTPAAGGVPVGGGSPAQEQLYTVRHRGKEFKVGLQELLNGYSRHADYTQRTQELTQREKDWTTRLGQYENAIRELRGVMSDRQKLAQILSQMPAAEGGSDGDEILTRSQVEAMRKQWFEEFAAQQTNQFQAREYQGQVNQLKNQYLGELQGVYASFSEQFPMLKKLPLFNELRLKVGTFDPQSIADAKALLANEIRELAKEAGWAPAGSTPPHVNGGGMPSPVVPGIEPPGGAGLMPPEGPRFSSLRDPGLKSAVLGDIEQLMRAAATT